MRTAVKQVLSLIVVGITWAALATTAHAQLPAAPEPEPKSYILAYVLVFLVIALGLAAVCRPSTRSDRPRMIAEDLEEKIRQMTGKP